MRKRNILIIATVVLLLLVAYVFAINYTPAEEPSPSESPAAESIVVFETDSSAISKITFDSQTPFSLINRDGVWYIEGNSAEIVQASALSISYSASYISAANKIEKAENLADFGLDNPSATVTVYHGDNVTKLLLGNKTPTDNYYYFKLDGDAQIYSISEYTADLFSKTPSSVRDLNVLSLSTDEITSIEISSPSNTLKVVKNADAAKADEKSYSSLRKWMVTSPVSQIAAEERVIEKLLTPLSSINAESVAADGAASLSKYNLNTSVSVKAADKTYSLKTGQADGVNYVYSPEKNIVYVVLKTNLSFLDVTAFDVIQRLITFPNIELLKSVEVKTENVSTTLTREEKSASETVYSINGSNTSEELFKSTYQSIMGLTIDGVISQNFTKSTPFATILYTLEDGSTEKIEFCDYDMFSSAVVLNGKAQFYIKKTKIDELEYILKKL